MGGTLGMRRGISGDGNRPWVAVWLVLMDRAMESRHIPGERRTTLKASLGNFLLGYRRHPGKIAAWEIRDYLFRNGELGGGDTPRSLGVSSEAIALFYDTVVIRPSLAEAARRPFDAKRSFDAPGDEGILELLREKLVENGAAGYLLGAAGSRDWSAG